MTLITTTPRRRPVSHAFSVPVVREIAPQSARLSANSAW
jgi:hypothetical protein